MTRAAAILALAFGAVLTVAEAARNWGDWQWWPFWLVDFVAAALLVAGGLRALQRRPGGRALLCGAWGFSTAMFYMSFWSHVASFGEPVDGNLGHGPLTVAVGALWILTIVGLVLATLGAREASA